MFVRLFCRPDLSELGSLTRDFLDLVIGALGLPVRCLPHVGQGGVSLQELPSAWQPYGGLFTTLVNEGRYANVASSNNPAHWTLLWTAGVSNILLTTQEPPPLDPQHLIYSGAYQAVVVPPTPTGALYAAWNATKVPTIVMPPLWGEDDGLCEVIKDALYA